MIRFIYHFDKSIVLPILSFKGLAHAYLMKRYMTCNKYLTFRLLEDNDPISAKSAAQTLSLNLTKTFHLLNFLITGICKSSASSSFKLTPTFVFTIARDPVFLWKNV